MNVTIVGAGRVGTTLAILLHKKGYRIASVISKRKTSAYKLAKLVKCSKSSTQVSDIAKATELIIISIPEENIKLIADEIAKKADVDFKTLNVFHTSGAHTSDDLINLNRKGSQVFSLHPIQTFPKEAALGNQLSKMKGIYYGFEGKTQNFVFANRIVESLNGKILRIPKERKILYHIACVFASNYSVTLLGIVAEMLKNIGGNIKLDYFAPLIKTSIDNAIQYTPKNALTGPIRRGSCKTVVNHLQKLIELDGKLAALYQSMAYHSLKIVKTKRLLNPKKIKQMEQILNRIKRGIN